VVAFSPPPGTAQPTGRGPSSSTVPRWVTPVGPPLDLEAGAILPPE